MEEQTQISQQEGGETTEDIIDQPQVEKTEEKVEEEEKEQPQIVNEEEVSGKSNIKLIIPIIGVIIVIALIVWFVI